MELILQILVGLTTLLLMALGTMSMFAPRRMVANFALEPIGKAGLNTIRSLMGGLFLGLRSHAYNRTCNGSKVRFCSSRSSNGGSSYRQDRRYGH